MQNEWNRFAGVRDNWTMNLYVPVLRLEPWPLYETLKHHVLDVSFPYILWDVWRFEIPPNRHVVLAWKIVFFSMFLFFLRIM
jgi:hypothetical protein